MQSDANPVDLFMRLWREKKKKKPAEQASNFKKADLHEKQTTTK